MSAAGVDVAATPGVMPQHSGIRKVTRCRCSNAGDDLANGMPDCLRDGFQLVVVKQIPISVPDFDLEAGEGAWPVVVKVSEHYPKPNPVATAA